MKLVPVLSSLALLLLCSAGSVANPAAANTAANPPVPATQPHSKPWWQDAVVYQIWPRSFADSNADGHGDFQGIIGKLPYLQQLGVNAIWLTPVFEAPSYHGYDFTEFYQVEHDYGSMADFKALIAKAHQANIRVILDLVINHISDQHDWFVRSARGEAPYKDYFIWQSQKPGAGWGPAWDDPTSNPDMVWHFNQERQAYYYAAFGASQPDLNLTHPAVVAEMKKMAKFWLDLGVDGFRLDAVRYAIEEGPDSQADNAKTLAYWQDFSQYVRSVNPQALLVGEAWADLPIAAKYYGQGQGLDAGFDFEFGFKVLELLSGKQQVSAEFGTMQRGAKIDSAATPLQINYQQRAQSGAPMGYFSPFLTNHDQPRLSFQLKQNTAKAKLAAAMLLTSPGTTYLYYGEEIGMTQESDREHIQRRAPMLWQQGPQAGFTSAKHSWVESNQLFPPQQRHDWWPPFLQAQLAMHHTVQEQMAQPHSLWALYHYLIKQKQQRAEFGIAGSYEATWRVPNKLLQIKRQLGAQQSLFLLNLSDQVEPIPTDISEHKGLTFGWREADTPQNQIGAWQLISWHN